MKLLFTLVIAFIINSCATVHHNNISVLNKDIYYYNIDGVLENRRPILLDAIAEFQNNVKCIGFLPYNQQIADDSHIVYFETIHSLPPSKIGLFISSLGRRAIFLAENALYPPNIITHNDNDLYFKVSIHKIAHFLGMPAHPFLREDSIISHLTPQLSNKSSKHMSIKDIEYLNNLVCKGSPNT